MKIAIDVRMITPKMHGISRYACNLIKELAKLDKENQYLLLANDYYLEGFVKINSNFRLKIVKIKLYSISEQILIPFVLRKEKVDLFHSLTYSAPVCQPCPTIMTIHDLIHLIFPEQYSIIHRLYYRLIVKQAAKKACKILTDSDNSKRDIGRLLNIPLDKIVTIYMGIDINYKPIKDVSCLEKFGISKNFIFSVLNNKPHKNLYRLLEAYDKIKKEKGIDYLLVIAGIKKEFISHFIEEEQLQDEIIVLGSISDNDLISLYNQAGLFVFPSLYEGFGLPVLEAMACGTPVVTSKASSLPEVVGDAAVLVNPFNVDELAEAIYNVISNRELQKEMILKGLERAKLFSWVETAKHTLKVYKECCGEKEKAN